LGDPAIPNCDRIAAGTSPTPWRWQARPMCLRIGATPRPQVAPKHDPAVRAIRCSSCPQLRLRASAAESHRLEATG
jgi:hypothetical protein